MMALKFIILVEKVANKSKLKEEGKKYKSCDNFHLHGKEAEYSNEGDNYETKKKRKNMAVKKIKNQKEMIRKKFMKDMKI